MARHIAVKLKCVFAWIFIWSKRDDVKLFLKLYKFDIAAAPRVRYGNNIYLDAPCSVLFVFVYSVLYITNKYILKEKSTEKRSVRIIISHFELCEHLRSYCDKLYLYQCAPIFINLSKEHRNPPSIAEIYSVCTWNCILHIYTI